MTDTVRIPADIEREDRVLGPLTARQAALLAAGGLLLYAGYRAASNWFSPLAYLALTSPIAGVLLGVALGRREGIGLDRFALAALRHLRAPTRMVHAPEGVPPLPEFLDRALARQAGPRPAPARTPCRGVEHATGAVDLGRDGMTALAVCSTVNFQLLSGAERQAAVAGFARWLNSLTGPAQILLRSHPLDVAPAARRLREQAAALPHPALAAAAAAHADDLARLGAGGRLLARQVLLAVREPLPGRQAAQRAARRLDEAVGTLSTADLTLHPLTRAKAADVVSAAFNPQPFARGEEHAR